MSQRITSITAFIEKIKDGYKLEKTKEFRRTLYYLTNRKEEITVAISLIKKLEAKGIVDSNWDVHFPSDFGESLTPADFEDKTQYTTDYEKD